MLGFYHIFGAWYAPQQIWQPSFSCSASAGRLWLHRPIRDVVVNPEILGWFLLVEGGWFGLMFFIYIFPRMIFPRRRV
jgi:hypothetical protein